MNKETIFALATIFGKSGVAVIRISGAEATKVFSYFQVKKKIIPRVATLVTLYDSQGFPLDKCLIIWFKSPHSFTGEDVVEFHIHGSKGVIKSLIEELGKIFRLAEPGEFSRKAFENNKLDLTEAEGLVDLIEAETKMQSRQALRQISGALRSLYDGWRINLIRIMAGLEAYIDFPDEDIPQEAVSHEEISQLIQEMENHLADNKRGQKMRSGFRIAITGRPNVGKSTLFNYLVKQDMAITSNVPGTTRDVLEAQIDLDGYPVTICDTAGIQGTLDPIELEGIIRAKKCAQESDMVLALFPYKDLRTMDNNIKLSTNNSILLASKADELTSVTKILIQDKELLPISVKTGSGLETLVSMIKTRISDEIGLSEAPIITRERHRKAVALAVDHLKRYNKQNDLILAAEDLRVAAKALGQITGDIRIDDVLDELFSKFCIGK